MDTRMNALPSFLLCACARASFHLVSVLRQTKSDAPDLFVDLNLDTQRARTGIVKNTYNATFESQSSRLSSLPGRASLFAGGPDFAPRRAGDNLMVFKVYNMHSAVACNLYQWDLLGRHEGASTPPPPSLPPSLL